MGPGGTWQGLSDGDTDTRTAVCSKCAPTPIRLARASRGPECGTKRAVDKAAYLKRKHGVDRGGLGSTCAICDTDQGLVVDHDHACCPGPRGCPKCVRGRLCRTCNLALGYLKNEPERLRKTLAYLER